MMMSGCVHSSSSRHEKNVLNKEFNANFSLSKNEIKHSPSASTMKLLSSVGVDKKKEYGVDKSGKIRGRDGGGERFNNNLYRN